MTFTQGMLHINIIIVQPNLRVKTGGYDWEAACFSTVK